MKKIMSGRSLEDLVFELKQMDQSTMYDRITADNTQIVVHIGNIGSEPYWSMSTTGNLSGLVIQKRGYGADSLYEAGKSLFEGPSSFFFTSRYRILAYCDYNIVESDSNGKLYTRWFVIKPQEPAAIDLNGEMCIPTEYLSFTPEELDLLLETGLVIHDIGNDVFYPIKESAIPSLGRIFDCSMISAGCPLGTAILLAEKMLSFDIKFAHYSRGERIRPVYAVLHRNNKTPERESYVEKVLSAVKGVYGKDYMLGSWEITNEDVRLEICLAGNGEGFDLVIPETAGTSIKCHAFVRIAGCKAYVKTSSLNQKRGEMCASLFEGAYDRFERFHKDLESLRGKQPEDKSSYIRRLKPIIGKKRYKELVSRMEGDQSGSMYEFLLKLVRESYTEFNTDKWNVALRQEYGDMVLSYQESLTMPGDGTLDEMIRKTSMDNNKLVVVGFEIT